MEKMYELRRYTRQVGTIDSSPLGRDRTSFVFLLLLLLPSLPQFPFPHSQTSSKEQSLSSRNLHFQFFLVTYIRSKLLKCTVHDTITWSRNKKNKKNAEAYSRTAILLAKTETGGTKAHPQWEESRRGKTFFFFSSIREKGFSSLPPFTYIGRKQRVIR